MHQLQPISWNPACLFRRCRISVNGVLCEDIDNFARLSAMITDMQSQQEQLSIAAEGFGTFDNNYGPNPITDTRKTYQSYDHNNYGVILQSRR
eukprot:193989-Heterocapsa_arctica.AAC.1